MQHCTARFIQTTQQWNVARTHLIVGVTCIKLGFLLLQNVLSLLNVLPLVLSVGCRRVDQYLVQYTGMYFVSSFVRGLCDCDTPVCGVLGMEVTHYIPTSKVQTRGILLLFQNLQVSCRCLRTARCRLSQTCSNVTAILELVDIRTVRREDRTKHKSDRHFNVMYYEQLV